MTKASKTPSCGWWANDDDDPSGPEFVITGDLTVDLRPSPEGRIYVITVEATDAAGNVSTSSVEVAVVDEDFIEDVVGEDDDDDSETPRCGATGAELLLIMGLVGILRRRGRRLR